MFCNYVHVADFLTDVKADFLIAVKAPSLFLQLFDFDQLL